MNNSAILQEDLEYICARVLKDTEFCGKTFLITGATGLIGSLLVKSILYVNQSLDSNIKVIAPVRNLEKARKIFGSVIENNNLFLVDTDLSMPFEYERKIDYIVHAASITSSREMVENPVGVLQLAFDSTRYLLELALKHKSKMIYVSSMEYYGQLYEGYDDVTEEKLGYLDLSKVRSCYPQSKRICETLCSAYATQYGVDVCSARLAQTFGAGVSLSDNRVFAQFAKSAMNNTDIILHTTGESEGNYCYTADAIYAIFLLLLKGIKGEAYNVAAHHSTIYLMAKMVAENIAQRSRVVVDIPSNIAEYGYAPEVRLKLNSDKLRKLGWSPTVSFKDSFRRMINEWELSEWKKH